MNEDDIETEIDLLADYKEIEPEKVVLNDESQTNNEPKEAEEAERPRDEHSNT